MRPNISVTMNHSASHPIDAPQSRYMNCISSIHIPAQSGKSPTRVSVSSIRHISDTAIRIVFMHRYITLAFH